MADDILNMSLDDIIKKNAEKSKQAKQSKQVKKNKGKDQPKPKQQAAPSNKLSKVTQGGVGKKAGFGRGRQGRPKVVIATVKNDATKRDALEGGGKWKHDMFKQVAGAASASNTAAGRTSGAKLAVSNLAFHVSEADLTELFSTCGRLQRVTIKYDRSGRSTGEADVIFAVAADAERAKREYNGAKLDGQAMQLEVQPLGVTGNGTTTLSSGIRITTAKGPSRTNLQLPRTFVQTVQATNGGGGRGGGSSRPKARLNSRVVRGRGGGGRMASDTMEE